jgi:hypothetical protein
MNIYQSINAIMRNVPSIAKDKKNVQQGYNFRGIDDMYNALNPLLAEYGVFATSEVMHTEREERQTKSGGTLLYSVLTVKFTFYATDGSFVTSTMIGEAMDNGDKASNKAMSTAYKYALMQLLCIPTADVKDTEYETHEVAPKASAPKALVAELPWLNATKKDGSLTDKGIEVSHYIAKDGKWEAIERKYKVSITDRKAVNDEAIRMRMDATDKTKQGNASQLIAQANEIGDGLPW